MVVSQALIGAVAHVGWYRAVNTVGPSAAAIFVNLQPVVGVGLAWLIVGETIGPWQVVGGALVVSGVGLTTQRRKQR